MNKDEAAQIRKHIHDVKNPLNSVTLHAELGKMLIENGSSEEDLEKVLSVILEQCLECGRVLNEIHKLAKQ